MRCRDFFTQNRWFILATLFLLVNAYGVLHLVRTAGRPDDRRVRVLSFEAGEEGAVRASQPLHWRFSSAMVSPHRVGRWRLNGPVSFEPAASGRFCWLSECELTFD
jgi:hypothetical protein